MRKDCIKWAIGGAVMLHAVGASAQDASVIPPANRLPADQGAASPGDPTPRVDPATGRPLPGRNASPDVRDAPSNARRSVTGRPTVPGDGPRQGGVPAYIALPDASASRVAQEPVRGDRGVEFLRIPGETVKQRRRPEYDPVPLTVGSIGLYPYVSGGLAYDSNVFAEDKGRDDVVFTAAAGVNARTDWNRHAVSLEGVVRYREYARFDTESLATYRVSGEGRLDLPGREFLTAGLSFERVALDRSTVDDVATQLRPTRYWQTAATLGGHGEMGRLTADANIFYRRQIFSDNASIAGTAVDQGFRDFEGIGGQSTVAWDVGGQRSLYGQASYERRRFDEMSGAINRDANLYRLGGGFRGRLTRLIRGRIGAGYMLIDFRQAGAESLRTFAVDADVEWLATRRDSFSLNVRRDLLTVAQRNSRGAVSTNVQLDYDREVRRNVILSLSFRQQWSDYVSDSRRATATGASIGGAWYLNRRLQMRPSLSYMKRTDRGFEIDADPEDLTAGVEVSFRF